MPVLAVHISDGVLAGPAVLAGWGLAAGLVAFSARRLGDHEVPRVGVLTAAFFVASQVHLPVGPGSAHLLLNGLVGVVLGRRAGVAVAVGLALQAVLFQHGGLTALGVNVCCYALPAVLAGVLFRPLRRAGRVPDFWLGCGLGGLAAGLTVGLATAAVRYLGAADSPAAAGAFLAANLPAVAVEAVGTGWVVRYLARAAPDWLD